MAKILVLYYSSYGHIETMAQAMAEGARSAGANELDGARFQGKHVAEITQRLVR